MPQLRIKREIHGATVGPADANEPSGRGRRRDDGRSSAASLQGVHRRHSGSIDSTFPETNSHAKLPVIHGSVLLVQKVVGRLAGVAGEAFVREAGGRRRRLVDCGHGGGSGAKRTRGARGWTG